MQWYNAGKHGWKTWVWCAWIWILFQLRCFFTKRFLHFYCNSLHFHTVTKIFHIAINDCSIRIFKFFLQEIFARFMKEWITVLFLLCILYCWLHWQNIKLVYIRPWFPFLWHVDGWEILLFIIKCTFCTVVFSLLREYNHTVKYLGSLLLWLQYT